MFRDIWFYLRELMGPWIWFCIGVWLTCGAAWLTHVIVCLKAHDWGFLIAGAIGFPIAIIHGIGIWFGAW